MPSKTFVGRKKSMLSFNASKDKIILLLSVNGIGIRYCITQLIEYSSIKELLYVCDVPCDIHVTTHVSILVTISIHVTTQYLRYD